MTSQEFTNLFQANKLFIYNYCHKLLLNKEEAEDITHDVFLTLWHHRYSIEINTAINYLTTSARNKCCDFGRRNLIKQKVLKHYEQGEIIHPYETGLEYDVPIKDIYALIDSLFPLQKKLVKMRYIEGHDPKEISKLLGKKRSTVRNQIFVGLSNIRKQLKSRGIYPG